MMSGFRDAAAGRGGRSYDSGPSKTGTRYAIALSGSDRVPFAAPVVEEGLPTEIQALPMPERRREDKNKPKKRGENS